jgi:hypothetical protein
MKAESKKKGTGRLGGYCALNGEGRNRIDEIEKRGGGVLDVSRMTKAEVVVGYAAKPMDDSPKTDESLSSLRVLAGPRANQLRVEAGKHNQEEIPGSHADPLD